MTSTNRSALAVAGLLGGLAAAGPAQASDNEAGQEPAAEAACRFTHLGSTLFLEADCTTRASLVIPEGSTLDGRGHTVRARDPEGGSFAGAVVRSGGRVAHLRNLTIVADGLAAHCHAASPVDERLRAVLFEGASGSITGVHVRGVGQASDLCQEGFGIDVRALGERAARDEERVLIAGCRVEGFQKTGVVVLGAVEVGLYASRVQGRGPLDTIAQNGVQIGRGARGSIKLTRVSGVRYTRADFTAVGVLAQDAGPLDLALNALHDTDVAVWLERTSGAELSGNRLAGELDALVIDGRTGPAANNHVHHNALRGAEVSVLILGEGARGNVVRDNRSDAPNGSVVELLGAAGNSLP